MNPAAPVIRTFLFISLNLIWFHDIVMKLSWNVHMQQAIGLLLENL
jgi:hypothetical protein